LTIIIYPDKILLNYLRGIYFMKILELFAGYGSQALALENLGFDVHSEISEIDAYAIKAYNQLHGETKNWGDITKINENDLGEYDLITYSFPCQDVSAAGLQKGVDKDSGTRSSLLWECERIINHCKPKYLLLENVKNLVGKKFKPCFDKWLETLDNLGYNNYWKVLNAKDYGIPQNRERVFVVSIRKDADKNGFVFPEKIPLEKRLKDMLDSNVDESYYLPEEKVKKFLQSLVERIDSQDSSYCIDANYWKGTTPEQFLEKHRRQLVKDVSNTIRCGGRGSFDVKHTWDIVTEPVCCASRGRNPDNPSDRTAGAPTEQRLEINTTGCSNTLTTVQKDNYLIEPFIADDTQGFDGVRYYENYSPTLRSERSGLKVMEPEIIQVGNIAEEKNFSNPQCGRIYSSDGVSPTLNTCGGGQREPKIVENYRIRKLTEREAFRLMGVKDWQYDKLQGISKTQKYKMAGNSIVVDVLEAIFREMFKDLTN
jgi:DNA (cytosine-5)-methyltransferase 1